MKHDRDQCGICFDKRAYALRRRGVPSALVRQLRWCGPPGVAQLRVLEQATSEQIDQVRSAYAEWQS